MKTTTYSALALISTLFLASCHMNDSAREPENPSSSALGPSGSARAQKTGPGIDYQTTNDQTAAGQTTADSTDAAMASRSAEDGVVDATAEIQAAAGTNIDGEARFSENGHGVKIVVSVRDAPVGEKGIHIHEKGDCSDIGGKSMGGHFAPQGDKHGLPDAPQGQIHLGDLGNIEIQADGTGTKEITVEEANLKEGDPMSFLGKALVIHESNDKGASEQPSGASGKPIACAVIQKS